MKNKIIQEMVEWCEKQENAPDLYLEDFVKTLIDKTTYALFDEIKNELKNEFEKGNLKHPFIISDEYYLYLKLKDIKNKLISPEKDLDYIEKEE